MEELVCIQVKLDWYTQTGLIHPRVIDLDLTVCFRQTTVLLNSGNKARSGLAPNFGWALPPPFYLEQVTWPSPPEAFTTKGDLRDQWGPSESWGSWILSFPTMLTPDELWATLKIQWACTAKDVKIIHITHMCEIVFSLSKMAIQHPTYKQKPSSICQLGLPTRWQNSILPGHQ